MGAGPGFVVGEHDLLTAAHTLSAGVTLVPHHVSGFEHAPGLRVEGWF